MGLYCASKYAVEALAEVYRYELAALGIDSVVLEPGAYRTPIMDKLERGADPARREGYGEMSGVPEKMGAALASTQANPQDIADYVVKIIETPAGQRPLRYRVAPNELGVSKINAVTDEVQGKVLEAFGLSEVTRFRMQ
jgi:NAD(P)-dependent dehydrogenase (short-subunit alcohol dehydrogenase family)